MVEPTGHAVVGTLIDPGVEIPKSPPHVLLITTAAGAGAVKTGQHSDTVTVAVTTVGQALIALITV